MTSIRNALIAIATATVLAGCGGANVTKTVNSASVGKELEDLKKAYDAGIINQQEYNQQRSRILNQR